MDDHAIVAGLIAGREDAAAAFVDQFGQRVLWTLRKLGVPDRDAEDIAQEVLLEAWRQMAQGRFESRSQLFTWLYPIIRGKAVEQRRRQRRRIVIREGALVDPSTSADQEAVLLAKEALATLPLRLNCVFRLHYRENLPIKEIAEVLNVSTKRVRNLLSEAKRVYTDAVLGRGTISGRERLTGRSE